MADEGEGAYGILSGMVFGVTAAMIVKDTYMKIFSADCPECHRFGRLVCKHCGGSGVLDKTRGGKDGKAFNQQDQLAVQENEYLCPFCQGDGVSACKRCMGMGWRHSPRPQLERLFNAKGPHFDRTIRLQKLKTKAAELSAVASGMIKRGKKTAGEAGEKGGAVAAAAAAAAGFSLSANDGDTLPGDSEMAPA